MSNLFMLQSYNLTFLFAVYRTYLKCFYFGLTIALHTLQFNFSRLIFQPGGKWILYFCCAATTKLKFLSQRL